MFITVVTFLQWAQGWLMVAVKQEETAYIQYSIYRYTCTACVYTAICLSRHISLSYICVYGGSTLLVIMLFIQDQQNICTYLQYITTCNWNLQVDYIFSEKAANYLFVWRFQSEPEYVWQIYIYKNRYIQYIYLYIYTVKICLDMYSLI